MRFHGLMLLRDERDIIVQNLTTLLTWIDALYIFDLGSTDGTWDVVQDFAKRDKRIVPFKSSPIIYRDSLRSIIFDHYRDRFDPGDWIMKIDADEFYHVTPPRFVKERLRPLETAVWLQWYFFRLTTSEVADYESGRVDISADRLRQIEDRRRYYKISEYAEPRMFKYRPSIRWWEHESVPFNAGYVARERIPIRHYPHRDPLQMEARFRLRARMMSIGGKTGDHWRLDDWRAEVVDAHGVSGASVGTKRGLSGETGIDTGQLHYWEPGTELVEIPLHSHIAPPMQRMAQRIVHQMLLPIFDARRKSFDRSYQPALIPQEIQTSLHKASAASKI